MLLKVCIVLAAFVAVSARRKEECGSEACYCGDVGGVTCNVGYNCVARELCNDPQGNCGGLCRKQQECDTDADCPGEQWCRPTLNPNVIPATCQLDKKVCVMPVMKYRRCGPGSNKCMEKRCASGQICLAPHSDEGVSKCADAVLKEGKMCKHTYTEGRFAMSNGNTILMDRSNDCVPGTTCTFLKTDSNRKLYTCQKKPAV